MSVVWVSVFLLLCIELIILIVLITPMPKRMQRFLAKKILSINLARKVRFVVNFITLGLFFAVFDAIQELQHLDDKAKDSGEGVIKGDLGSTGYVSKSLDKQRKFRAERNLYLAGFTLVSLFVIARLVELMQANVDLEEQRDSLQKKLSDSGLSAADYKSIDSKKSDRTAGLRRRTHPGATAE